MVGGGGPPHARGDGGGVVDDGLDGGAALPRGTKVSIIHFINVIINHFILILVKPMIQQSKICVTTDDAQWLFMAELNAYWLTH